MLYKHLVHLQSSNYQGYTICIPILQMKKPNITVANDRAKYPGFLMQSPCSLNQIFISYYTEMGAKSKKFQRNVIVIQCTSKLFAQQQKQLYHEIESNSSADLVSKEIPNLYARNHQVLGFSPQNFRLDSSLKKYSTESNVEY